MLSVIRENYVDAARGLHWYCADNHGGMGCDLYRIMCALDYKPAMSERGADDDDLSGEVYSALIGGQLDAQETLDAIHAAMGGAL